MTWFKSLLTYSVCTVLALVILGVFASIGLAFLGLAACVIGVTAVASWSRRVWATPADHDRTPA